jgi:hypothetical protein
MYDVFYVGKGFVDTDSWERFSHRFPKAQKLENIKTFEEVKSRSFTKCFWVVWDYVNLNEVFNLDYLIPKWDEEYIHVFKNGDYYDGICIFPRTARILQREWDYRFFIKKKEIKYQASTPQLSDVVFISYHEPFADERFADLVPRLRGNKIFWIKDIRGIHQAHIEAAKTATTDMFYVVDADAIIENTFKFDHYIPYYDFNAKHTVYVWKSRNPVNGLEYGNGGIKLLPRQLTIDMDVSKPDITTSISKWFKPMPTVSNTNGFNTDPFNSWKSAFRECCKLSSRVIDRQDDTETQQRLDTWCTVGTDIDVLAGAIAGRKYGEENKLDVEALKKINNFKWLEEQFYGR